MSGASGTPATASATLGAVTAKLAGTVSTLYGQPALASATLSVSSGGATPTQVTVATPNLAASGSSTSTTAPGAVTTSTTPPGEVTLWSIGPDDNASVLTDPEPLCVSRFGATSPVTAVVVGVDTGGAHCCLVLDTYTMTSSGLDPEVVQQTIGDPGASVEDVHGAAVVRTADDAFAYQFDSYAGSGMPVMALELRGRTYVDTTPDHLDWVAADAAKWWSTYEQDHAQAGGLGLLAPWVADECLLGKAASAWATVDQLQRQGALTSTLPEWPSGAAYVTALQQFLVQHHYCPARG